MICNYCHYWFRSALIHEKNKKKCHIMDRDIKQNDKSCKYFKLASYFYCYQNNCYLQFLNCLNRRRNKLKLNSWQKCRRCREFEKHIKQICIQFGIKLNRIITIKPKKKRIITKKPRKITKKI